MKRWELVENLAPAFKMCRKYSVKYSDVEHLEAFREYMRRKSAGEKMEYIVRDIGAKYSLSRSAVFQIVRHMNENI